MMNRPIDAVVVSAALKRAAFGERVYDGVILRRRDGSETHVGRVTVASRLGDTLIPGRDGRFHFHDVMGSQGLHAFTPSRAPADRNAASASAGAEIAFPMLIERAFALLAVINLAIVAAWLSTDALLPMVPLALGIAATTAWATWRGCREAVLHDFKYESRVAARSHRQAVLGRV